MSERVSGRRLDELQFRAWRAFLYAYGAVVPRLDQELGAAHDITLNQFEILAWLRDAGAPGLRMSELASRVVLSPSGATRAVDQLERRGFVARFVVEDDRRGSLATLTPAGRALLRRATNAHLRRVREHFLRHLTRSDLERLTSALEAILDGEGTPLPPVAAPQSA